MLGIMFNKSECLKPLTRNHYKNIWRVEFAEKVMHIIQLSHVLQGEVDQVFFYSNTYTDCLVAEFPVLEHLWSAYLYPINSKKTSHKSRKWKNWLTLWMPSQNTVIMEWLSILFLYGHYALFQWVICKYS